MNRYSLPDLPYNYGALEPHLSEEQLKIHHDKHHKAYVDKANKLLRSLAKAREDNSDVDMKAMLKSLSWNIGGHVLHSLYWENLTGDGNSSPKGTLKEEIIKEFGSFERFKKEFTQAAKSVEGSGWAALTYCKKTKGLKLMQIEKHNTNIMPMFAIVLVLDMFEHAYYIDYQNEKAGYIDAFWDMVDWQKVNDRLEEAM